MDWFELFWIVLAGIGWALCSYLYTRLRITQDELDALAEYFLFEKNARDE